jgi:hypothetical protein
MYVRVGKIKKNLYTHSALVNKYKWCFFKKKNFHLNYLKTKINLSISFAGNVYYHWGNHFSFKSLSPHQPTLSPTPNLKFSNGEGPFMIYQIKGHKIRKILVKEKLKSHHTFTRYCIVKGVFDNFNPYLIKN